MAPMLLLAFLLTLLEALLPFPFTLLTSVGLSQLSECLALFGKRLLRLGGGASLCKFARRLALAALWVRWRFRNGAFELDGPREAQPVPLFANELLDFFCRRLGAEHDPANAELPIFDALERPPVRVEDAPIFRMAIPPLCRCHAEKGQPRRQVTDGGIAAPRLPDGVVFSSPIMEWYHGGQRCSTCRTQVIATR